MRSFANASVLLADGEHNLHLAWLAGLLEGEGTFICPLASEPGAPIVACWMTDRDVVERVATLFGCGVFAMDRSGRRQRQYGTRLKGSRAAMLMMDLAPAMSGRRATAIGSALQGYSPPDRKLDFATAEEIRDLYAEGASVSWLSRTFGVARSTIRLVLRESIYGDPPATPWRQSSEDRGATVARAAAEMTARELCWLAGWLEGEGSFCRPPPCDPRRPRIMGKTRDADVAEEVGRLLRVKPVFSHDARARSQGWSPTWRLLRQGRAAISRMKALYPLMGARRRGQIEAALAAVGDEPEMEAVGVAPTSVVTWRSASTGLAGA